MTTYTWKIHSVVKKVVNTVDSVVISTTWEKFGTAPDGYSGSVKAAANFNIGDIDESSFVPYDQLSEDDVVQWVRDFINEEGVDKIIEAEIQKARDGWMEVRDEYLPWNVVREE